MNRCWFLPDFFALTDRTMSFSVFVLLKCWMTLIDFWILNQPCIPAVNPIGPQCVILCAAEFYLLMF